MIIVESDRARMVGKGVVSRIFILSRMLVCVLRAIFCESSLAVLVRRNSNIGKFFFCFRHNLIQSFAFSGQRLFVGLLYLRA